MLITLTHLNVYIVRISGAEVEFKVGKFTDSVPGISVVGSGELKY